MLEKLIEIEDRLHELLHDGLPWNTLFVDYHHPYVERVWRQVDDVRVYLHKIHPCKAEEALFHPHPWPSAMRIVDGEYEMAVGFSFGSSFGNLSVPPPIAAKILLCPGSAYEMTNPDSWHYVRPLNVPSMSLMIAGKPWRQKISSVEKPLGPLTDAQQYDIIKHFKQSYAE